MIECKLVESPSDQDVKIARHPMCVLTYEWQLNDMSRFLTFNESISVLTVDTTYNLGEFYVKPMAYCHLMLQDIKTQKHPIMLCALLVHQKVDYGVFNYYASTLIGLKKDIRNVLSFGTDGDKVLVKALSHNFSFSIPLRCFIHFKRNIEEKLRDLGISSIVSAECVTDILVSILEILMRRQFICG